MHKIALRKIALLKHRCQLHVLWIQAKQQFVNKIYPDLADGSQDLQFVLQTNNSLTSAHSRLATGSLRGRGHRVLHFITQTNANQSSSGFLYLAVSIFFCSVLFDILLWMVHTPGKKMFRLNLPPRASSTNTHRIDKSQAYATGSSPLVVRVQMT